MTDTTAAAVRTGRIRHAHRPWHLSRWLECGGRAVVWSLDTALCEHCPDCAGAGGWWTSSPYSDEPEMEQCPRCATPLIEIRIPARLDRMIPRSPTRDADPWAGGHIDDEPPF
ncbi:hypothetical protein [Nocardia sp. NPDC051750]|uniref:hypothetical protein n=1 Tax=Nocardia sp. NPDC051750 TaxID=3364325 RepID=UPI00378CCF5B